MQEAPCGGWSMPCASDPWLQLPAPETSQTQQYSSEQTDLGIFPLKLLLLGAFSQCETLPTTQAPGPEVWGRPWLEQR